MSKPLQLLNYSFNQYMWKPLQLLIYSFNQYMSKPLQLAGPHEREH
jgi:hypothetical protein